MKEFKGTPGPWEVHKQGGTCVVDPGGKVVTCFVANCETDPAADVADALLAAAAPDLLAALQAAWAAMDRETACGSHLATERHMARKAIAKALGDDCD